MKAGLLPYLGLARRPMLWMADLNEIANLTSNWGLLEALIDQLPPSQKSQMKPMLGLCVLPSCLCGGFTALRRSR
jgi:hypothetical protein